MFQQNVKGNLKVNNFDKWSTDYTWGKYDSNKKLLGQHDSQFLSASPTLSVSVDASSEEIETQQTQELFIVTSDEGTFSSSGLPASSAQSTFSGKSMPYGKPRHSSKRRGPYILMQGNDD